MTSASDGGRRVSSWLYRVAFGDRPKDDPEFEAALEQALTREQERERRLRLLQERLEIMERR